MKQKQTKLKQISKTATISKKQLHKNTRNTKSKEINHTQKGTREKRIMEKQWLDAYCFHLNEIYKEKVHIKSSNISGTKLY